jgi:SPP1 gp7 family putative phage head morphogenesis protein
MHLIELANDDVMAESERILRAVFNNELRSGTIDQDLIIAVAEKLKSGVIKGFKNDVAIDFNSPDYRMLLNLKKNVYGFSAAKNYQEILAMNNLLTDENGAVKSFDQFKADAMPLYEIYNTDYLKTEYNLAINGATAASRWVGFEENKEEMPLLMYQTVGDDRVRAEHRVLDRTIRPVGDSFWNVYYPPNGFNCRCTVNQIPQGTATPRADVPLPEIDPMFRVNLAKKNLIFPPDHPYYDGCPKDIVLKGQDLMK